MATKAATGKVLVTDFRTENGLSERLGHVQRQRFENSNGATSTVSEQRVSVVRQESRTLFEEQPPVRGLVGAIACAVAVGPAAKPYGGVGRAAIACNQLDWAQHRFRHWRIGQSSTIRKARADQVAAS